MQYAYRGKWDENNKLIKIASKVAPVDGSEEWKMLDIFVHCFCFLT